MWRWASITKQLTAVLAMQEVARGRLDLDAPVSRYWRRWRSPAAEGTRIRDLLLHQSGLPQPDNLPVDSDGVPAFYRSAAASPHASANGYCAGEPRARAPAKFNYNNCDSIVLAEVLARITGKPFETLMQERFARPLRMRSFGMFRINSPAPEQVRPNGEFSKEDALLNLGVLRRVGRRIRHYWRPLALRSPAPRRSAVGGSTSRADVAEHPRERLLRVSSVDLPGAASRL